MKKILLIVFLIACVVQSPYAQNRRNSVQFELGGNGLLYSLGYERLAWEEIALKAGVSFFRLTEKGTDKDFNIATLPIGVSYLLNISKARHFAELGVGANFICLSSTMNSYVRETDYYLNPTANIGYRYYSKNGRWIYKVSFTPFYGTRPINDSRLNQQQFSLFGKGFQFWGGIGIGYRF